MFRLFSLMLAALLFAATVSAARAGDYAQRLILGFSPDGRYFAFEEFGIQDGSGFPFSNIYVIDGEGDRWVAGTPVRVRIDNENATLEEARMQARAGAQATLTQLGIGAEGDIVASNPMTETSADPFRVTFLPRAMLPVSEAPWSLSLSQITVPAPPLCTDFGPFFGMRLNLDRPGLPIRTLTEDRSIPGSRNCPVGYGISDVIMFPEGRPTVMVVLINLFNVGFEGPNRRFLAVTTRLD